MTADHHLWKLLLLSHQGLWLVCITFDLSLRCETNITHFLSQLALRLVDETFYLLFCTNVSKVWLDLILWYLSDTKVQTIYCRIYPLVIRLSFVFLSTFDIVRACRDQWVTNTWDLSELLRYLLNCKSFTFCHVIAIVINCLLEIFVLFFWPGFENCFRFLDVERLYHIAISHQGIYLFRLFKIGST